MHQATIQETRGKKRPRSAAVIVGDEVLGHLFLGRGGVDVFVDAIVILLAVM